MLALHLERGSAYHSFLQISHRSPNFSPKPFYGPDVWNQNGEDIFESDIVSGDMRYSDRQTPAGIYTIYYKKSPDVLRGKQLANGKYEYEQPATPPTITTFILFFYLSCISSNAADILYFHIFHVL